MKINATITAVSHFVPKDKITNHDLEKLVDTNDEWIRSRTGISERRILKNGATSDLAIPAIKKIIEQKNLDPLEIDAIIVATVTPDMFFPSTACIIQQKIVAKNAIAFDLSAACSGFLYALVVGAQMIESGSRKKVLVIGADKMSSILDYKDRNTCILFGDGAGVVLLEPSPIENYGIIDHRLYSDGSGAEFLYMKGSGSLNPPTHETIDKGLHYLVQDGKAVFKEAVLGMANVSVEVMQRNNLTSETVDWLVPHQANLRIIDACAERMGIDKSKVMINIDRYGNTTAATIPICLSEWHEQGKIKKGQNLILSSFGAGYTWGAVYIKWSID
ncbi:MAG: ketoacyl-ACP synthase III [Bacteroidetes bacterium]|nr:ketoacyl-ACP synthase III [Bacteroidota bacterium]